MDSPPVIIDPGSFSVKAGLPGDLPSVEVPSVIARPRPIPGRSNYGCKCDRFVGHDATNKRGSCLMRYPIEHGFVTDWDDYVVLLFHTFYEELRVNPAEHRVLIAENPRNPRVNTEKIVELAMEEIDIPFLCIQNTASLSLLTEKLETGLVIELGDGAFSVIPIYEGQRLPDISPRIPWGGRYITDLLKQQMLKDESAATSDQKDSIKRSMFCDTLHDIKHKHCFVSNDYERDFQNSQAHAQTYEMPDGTDLKLSYERFVAPESFFKPGLLGIEMYGLPRQISDILTRAEEDVMKKLLPNVVLSGGSSLFPGLAERFQKELEECTGQKVHVVASPNRKYSAWIGGSRFVSGSSALDSKVWLSKEEYEEEGPLKIFSKMVS